MTWVRALSACFVVILLSGPTAAETAEQLRTGRAGHAFDHLGGFDRQADAAAASGATIVYATGLGDVGYAGLPPATELAARRQSAANYNRDAKAKGIELSIGYVCATSIVKLDTFDQNWPAELRGRLKTRPAEWLQQDRHGKPLASWYGGDYRPACMSNPDWRTYEEFMVRQQLEAGHDGIFFDNPTVHPEGCYCPHCMNRFADFVEEKSDSTSLEREVPKLREYAVAHPKEFAEFRGTVARDFLDHLRKFARTINPEALITCNNSLNTPAAFFSQCRAFGYNIWELSKVEDLVVVEDMATQPRVGAGGAVFEYGPTYKLLHAIGHGKPIVAVTLADGDYHTPPSLVRLAMAEAGANDASYLSWPTWPEAQRERMAGAIRPQADVLRKNERLLNDTEPRADVVLLLRFRRWLETEDCAALKIASALSQANVQYTVVNLEEIDSPRLFLSDGSLVIESETNLTATERQLVEGHRNIHGRVVVADKPDWIKTLRSQLAKPSLTLEGPPTVRAVVRDQSGRTVVHLYNLHIERLSSFEDKVTPATNLQLSVRVPFASVGSVTSHTADAHTTSGPLEFHVTSDGDESVVRVDVPRLDISTILEIVP